MAIVKTDPSVAVTSQAALVNANQAAAAAVTYWSSLCLYKLLALPHPVAASALDGALETPSSSSSLLSSSLSSSPRSSLPADMRSRLLAKVHHPLSSTPLVPILILLFDASLSLSCLFVLPSFLPSFQGAVDAIMTALLGHKAFCADQETVVAALLMVLFAAFSCPASDHDPPDPHLDDSYSYYEYGNGSGLGLTAASSDASALLEGVMGGLRAKAVGSYNLCDRLMEALRRHPSSRQVREGGSP